jgi:hypothetical protein
MNFDKFKMVHSVHKGISLLMSKEGLLIFTYHQSIWWGNLQERDHFEDPVLDGRIILRWILRKWDVGGMD